MMIRSYNLGSFPIFVEAKDIHGGNASARCLPVIRCSSTKDVVPKLETFSRSKLEKIVRDPPLIEKAEKELTDYCLTLEGDESYSCWRAYFELKDLQRETPKEDVEKLILQIGGVKSLIGCLHGIASIHKGKKIGFGLAKPLDGTAQESSERGRHFHVPDGLPKSQEELEEEEKARMPDSPFTRLLRSKGKFPAWYSPAPDHETD